MVDDNKRFMPIEFTPYEQEYMDTINNLKNVFLRKNADYGSSVKKNYDKLEKYGPNEGLKYVFGRISEKYDRLENLIYGDHPNQVVDESIADTLLDMANYAILASISFNEHCAKKEKQESMRNVATRRTPIDEVLYQEPAIVAKTITDKSFYGD